MHAMPFRPRERIRHMAGIATLSLALSAFAARARTPLDFSLDREIRWRTAPAFTVNPPPTDPPAQPIPRPNASPPRRPSHPDNGTTAFERHGLTLLKFPFAF